MLLKELTGRNISAGLREVTNARMAAENAKDVPNTVLDKLLEAERALEVAQELLRQA